MSEEPLLEGMTHDEIREAAARWKALMSIDRMVWSARAGFEGDFYPTEHPDERHLTLSMWTRFHEPGHGLNLRHSEETKELLTQFADVVRRQTKKQLVDA